MTESVRSDISQQEHERAQLGIVFGNLKLMRSSMELLLAREESWGCNAGEVEIDGKPTVCAAANGVTEKNTGRILEFGNTPSKEILQLGTEFYFRIAGMTGAVFSWNADDSLSPQAVKNMEKTIKFWNALKGVEARGANQ